MPQCVSLVAAAVVLLNSANEHALVPIEMSQVTFRDSVVFVDTLISGNEAADEHTIIYAKIPLQWTRQR